MSINSRLDKQIAEYSHSGKIRSSKNGESTSTSINTDKSHIRNVEQKEKFPGEHGV